MSYIIIKIDDFEDFTCGADHHYEFWTKFRHSSVQSEWSGLGLEIAWPYLNFLKTFMKLFGLWFLWSNSDWKMHEVSFQGTNFEDSNASKDFISAFSQYRCMTEWTWLVTILNYATYDATLIEKTVI